MVGKGFKVVLGPRRVQADQMVIEPGGMEGGANNRHCRADRWLFVLAGRGTALVKTRRIALKAGSLLLIEHGEQHEIRHGD